MKPDLFFENFELLADAPNGIQKLRKLILQLAFMGKLLPQDPNDEPASILLENINAEKKSIIRGDKNKKSSLTTIDASRIPYKIPSSWIWTQFINVYDVRDGTHDSPKYLTEGFPLVTSKNLSDGYLNLTNVKYISEIDHIKISDRSKVNRDDILFAMIGSIGNPVIVDVDIEFSIKNVALFKYYSKKMSVPRYLKFFLEIASHYMRKQANGGVQSFVSLGYLRKYPFPLPPLNEQKRIVSKVDELMALCDKLEARQHKKQELQNKLNNAALDKMLNAENQEEFEQYWQRICENFDLIYDNSENIEKLKQAILQLAIQGKLVPQNPEDEPASVLIKKIQTEKKRLAIYRKIKEANISQPDITEVPYELPQGWEWCRWNDVSMQIGDLDHKMPLECDEGIPYVSPKDFYDNNGINFTTAKKISREDFERLRQKIKPEKNDIIFPRYGTIGENRFVVTENEFLASYSCAVIKSMNEMMEAKYSYYYSLSPLVKSEIMKHINKTTQPNVGLKSIQIFFYPLPPLAEQKRIVEKVEQLMGLCCELEAKLRTEREDSEKLMEAIVKGLLEGSATEKTELDKLVPLQVVAD